MTDSERKLWGRLRRKQLGGYRFRRQLPIGLYIVDFACLGARLIVELDGSQHLEEPTDVHRTAWLEGQGFRVLRFWNHEVLLRTDEVVDAIWLALVR
jgi:very-short-patch-repair endonuclease